MIGKGIDANLDVHPRASWADVVEQRLAGLDPFSRETRELQRFFFSGVVDAVPDKQGRVLVPPKLAERAGLDREVVVVGVYDHLEIWDRKAWTEHLHAVEGRVDDVAERLAEKRS